VKRALDFKEHNNNNNNNNNYGMVGLMVRPLAFHQSGRHSISALSVKDGLSLLVPYSALRGFSPGTLVFPSHQKPTFDLLNNNIIGK